MTPPVERIGHAQNRRELAHCLPLHSRELREIVMVHSGRRFAVIARDVGDHGDLISRESAQPGVADQVVGVFVVPLKRNVHARFMEESGTLEELALAGLEHVQVLELIEHPQRETGHMRGVGHVDVRPLGQLQNRGAPNAGRRHGLLGLTIEHRLHDALAQGDIARAQPLDLQAAHDLLEHHGARDDGRGTLLIHAEFPRPFLCRQRRELRDQLAQPRQTQPPQTRRDRLGLRLGRHCRERTDRAGGADREVESDGGNARQRFLKKLPHSAPAFLQLFIVDR